MKQWEVSLANHGTVSHRKLRKLCGRWICMFERLVVT